MELNEIRTTDSNSVTNNNANETNLREIGTEDTNGCKDLKGLKSNLAAESNSSDNLFPDITSETHKGCESSQEENDLNKANKSESENQFKNKNKNSFRNAKKPKNPAASLDFLDYYNYLKPHPFFSQRLNSGDFSNDEYTIIHENKKPNLNSYKNNDLLLEEPEEVLIFIVHGIGQNEEKLKTILNDRIKVMISLLYDKERTKFTSSLHFRMIDWKTPLFEREKENFNDLVDLNNKSKFPKTFIQNVPLDLMQYMSERNKYKIINDVVSQINSYFYLVKKHRKNFKGNVSIIGHSLGSVIMYEILSHMTIDEKFRDYGMNQFFNLSSEEFLEEVFNAEIEKDEKFKEVFFSNDFKNFGKGKKKDKTSKKEYEKRKSDDKDQCKGNTRAAACAEPIRVENAGKFSFKHMGEEAKNNVKENENGNLHVISNDIHNVFKGKNTFSARKDFTDEEYISNLLLKKRSERKSTLAKIKIIDEESCDNGESSIKCPTEESQNSEKKCFAFENIYGKDGKNTNANQYNFNPSETIIKIFNDLLINKLDPKRLDLKFNKFIEEENKKKAFSEAHSNNNTETDIFLGNVKTDPQCEILDKSLDSAKPAGKGKENNFCTNKMMTDPNDAEKSFEELDVSYKQSNTCVYTKKTKQNLTSEFNNSESKRLNTNPISDNDLSKKFDIKSFAKNKNVNIKRRFTNAIPLEEVTNTVGSLYSKITNVDLVAQNINKHKADPQQNGLENESNIDNVNNKAYNEMIKKHLFDYRRRIYLKTQHRVFLHNSASLETLNKNNKPEKDLHSQNVLLTKKIMIVFKTIKTM